MSDTLEDARQPYDRVISVVHVRGRSGSSRRRSSPSTFDCVSQHPPESDSGTNLDHLVPYSVSPSPPQIVNPPVPNTPLPVLSSISPGNSASDPSHASSSSPDSQLHIDPDRDPVSALAQGNDRIGPELDRTRPEPSPADQPAGSTAISPLHVRAPPLDWLAWNYNGIDNAKTAKHLKELRNQRRLKVVFLCETRLKRVEKRKQGEALSEDDPGDDASSSDRMQQ